MNRFDKSEKFPGTVTRFSQFGVDYLDVEFDFSILPEGKFTEDALDKRRYRLQKSSQDAGKMSINWQYSETSGSGLSMIPYNPTGVSWEVTESGNEVSFEWNRERDHNIRNRKFTLQWTPDSKPGDGSGEEPGTEPGSGDGAGDGVKDPAAEAPVVGIQTHTPIHLNGLEQNGNYVVRVEDEKGSSRAVEVGVSQYNGYDAIQFDINKDYFPVGTWEGNQSEEVVTFRVFIHNGNWKAAWLKTPTVLNDDMITTVVGNEWEELKSGVTGLTLDVSGGPAAPHSYTFRIMWYNRE